MRKVVLVITVVLILLVASYLVIRNKTSPSFTSHGPQVLTVHTDGDTIGQAKIWIVNALADRNTLRQSERSWKDEKGRIQAARGRTEFQSKDATHYIIETIHIPGHPTTVLLSSDNDQATIKLHNEFVKCLSKAGGKPKKSSTRRQMDRILRR